MIPGWKVGAGVVGVVVVVVLVGGGVLEANSCGIGIGGNIKVSLLCFQNWQAIEIHASQPWLCESVCIGVWKLYCSSQTADSAVLTQARGGARRTSSI